ncbi:hypothetical protein GmHk_17G049430 [Glycine max]|nr:hypothetical protein GmHk_17G049430 [Glycine max]
MLGHGCEPGMGLGRNRNGIARLVEFAKNRGRFWLGYEPTRAEKRRIALERKERSSAQPRGLVGWMCEGQISMINEETPQDQPIWVRSCPLEFELGNWQVVKQPEISITNSM